MKKNLKKMLALSLALCMASASAATARAFDNHSKIQEHTIGFVGSFNQWENDIALTDEDGDGIYTGEIEIDSVQKEMLTSYYDEDEYIELKVRLDGEDSESWGDYDFDKNMTYQSSRNISLNAHEGNHIIIHVEFDTTKACDEAQSELGEINDHLYQYWGVNAYIEDMSTNEPSDDIKVNPENIKNHQVGFIGSFNQWKEDIAMTDDDGDGIYTGILDIESVTESMLGTSHGKIEYDENGYPSLQLKVRLDSNWDDNWGPYSEESDSTYNSRNNISLPVETGKSYQIKVSLDTTKPIDIALQNNGFINQEDIWLYWEVKAEAVRQVDPYDFFTDHKALKNHQVAVIGSFNQWERDYLMTDTDDDGIFTAEIRIPEVTEEMLQGKTSHGEDTIQFKVRLDGSWENSWGAYETGSVSRTYNSQTNLSVPAKLGEALNFKVYFNTNQPDEAYINQYGQSPESFDQWKFWGVSYEILKEEEKPVENSQEEKENQQNTQTSSSQNSQQESASSGSASSNTLVNNTNNQPENQKESPRTGDNSNSALALVIILLSGIIILKNKK